MVAPPSECGIKGAPLCGVFFFPNEMDVHVEAALRSCHVAICRLRPGPGRGAVDEQLPTIDSTALSRYIADVKVMGCAALDASGSGKGGSIPDDREWFGVAPYLVDLGLTRELLTGRWPDVLTSSDIVANHAAAALGDVDEPTRRGRSVALAVLSTSLLEP